MPAPGVIGLLGSAVSAVLATATGNWAQAIAAGVALVALSIWLVVYTRVSAPINKQMTAAAEAGQDVADGRALQGKWDRVIDARALLQGVAVAALCVVLMT